MSAKFLRTRLLFALFIGCAFCFDPTTYPQKAALGPLYNIYWRIESGEIYIALEVQTNGWIGFGIGEPTSGSMSGSDILTAYIATDGTVVLEDRYALAEELPSVDTCQDWILVSGQLTSDGKTVVEVSRALSTGDPQDRDIVSGSNQIIWAFGETTEVSYHYSNRKAMALTFFGTNPTAPAGPDQISYTLQVVSTNVPSNDTVYMCQTFPLPTASDLHIIEIQGLITSPLVHHTVVHGCIANTSWVSSRVNSPTQCYTAVTNIPPECNNVLWAWSPGMGPLILPSQAGFRVSSQSGYQFLLVQTHYNNPDNIPVQDNSNYVVTMTPHLRTYDAGVLTLGDPHITARSIPAQSVVSYEFSCSPTCTSTFPSALTVFGDFLHMHQLGSRIYSNLWHGSNSLGVLNKIDFWDYDFQQTTPVSLVIQPGDRINTRCIYDTTSETTSTNFGLSSSEEMCVEFVYYYPQMPQMDVCGYLRDIPTNKNYSICGPFDNPEVFDERNPTVPDAFLPISYGTVIATCPLDTGSHVILVMETSVGAMVGVCLLSIVVIVGMMGGLLVIAMKSKSAMPHIPIAEEEEEH